MRLASTAFASADPLIFIAPADNPGGEYSILLSEGVGNGLPSAVPEPATWARASTAKFSGEQRPELQNPSPHRFVGDIQTALRKQIFYIAIAERETHIQPSGVPDDRRRKLAAGK
jgi:hypothetical protein